MKSHPKELEDLQAKVFSWRATKEHRASRIPDYLMNEIVSFSQRYGHSKISSSMGIKKPQIDSYIARKSVSVQSHSEESIHPIQVESHKTASFTKISLPITGSESLLEIESLNGLKLKLYSLDKAAEDFFKIFCKMTTQKGEL